LTTLFLFIDIIKMDKDCILILLSCFCLHITAQTYYFSGKTFDAATKQSVDSVKVILMKMDSTKIDSLWTRGDEYEFDSKTAGKYILKFVKRDYYPFCINEELKPRKIDYGVYKDIYLRQKLVVKELGPATVKATLIKMVMNKDTLVYNAAAFQLAEGSMLDQLIRQLPGVELKDGQIKVNGKFVSSLYVNGKDFFNGNPKIALENLPAYMVNKIKVYEKEDEELQGLHRATREDEKKLIMDVRLKKQYSIGWVANAQGGTGTRDRYLARIFALRFTRNSRFCVFGNMNNTNDAYSPQENGSWKQLYSFEGKTSNKRGGMQWNTESKNERYKLSLQSVIEHKDGDNEQKSSHESFLQDGDVYSRTLDRNRNEETNITANGEIVLCPRINGERSYIHLDPTLFYRKYNNNGNLLSAMFSKEPTEQYRGAAIDSLFLFQNGRYMSHWLINKLKNRTYSFGHSLNVSGSWYAGLTFDPYNYVRLEGDATYGNSTDRSFSQYDLRYPENTSDEGNKNVYHNYYTDLPRMNYKYNFGFVYKRFTNRDDVIMLPYFLYTYSQEHRGADRDRFLLERLKGWGQDNDMPLGSLPSLRDSLQMAIDASNSYHSIKKVYSHKPQISWSYGWETKKKIKYDFSIDAPLRIEANRLYYDRNLLDTLVTRQVCYFEPEIKLSRSFNEKYEFRQAISYKVTHTVPEMTYLLNIRDDANPLYVNLGNPQLSNLLTHHVNLWGRENDSKSQKALDYSIDYQVTKGAIAMSREYDRQTGVTTYQPQNVDGNWSLEGNLNYGKPVDKAMHLRLSDVTNVSYYNSVDLVQITGEDKSVRSSVHTFTTNEELKADYSYGLYSVGGRIGVNWIHEESSRSDFKTISSRNWTYGLTGVLPLPWKMQLSSELTLLMRRGYNDKSMNDEAWLWNARLSKTILHGNMTFILDGFDILNSLKDIRRNIDSQGRTETWYNVVNRYVMLHVFYRFDIQSKKK